MEQRLFSFRHLFLGLILMLCLGNLQAQTFQNTINSATPSACDPATSKYSLTVTVGYAFSVVWGSKVYIGVGNNGTSTRVDTFIISANPTITESFTLNNLTANGETGIDVSLDFQINIFQNAGMMNAYDAPVACSAPPPPTCLLDLISAQPEACDNETNYFRVFCSVGYSGAGNPTIVVIDTAGNELFKFPFAFTPHSFHLSRVADGQLQKIYIYLESDPSCKDSVTIQAPPSCVTPPSCNLDIATATPSACTQATNTYSLELEVTYANYGSNTEMIFSDSIIGPLDTVSISTSPQTITLNNLASNGRANTKVYAYMRSDATCRDSITYHAPASCSCPTNQYQICKDEAYTITAQAGLKTVQWQKLLNGSWTDIYDEIYLTLLVNSIGTFRYIGTDSNDCAITMCCPFVFTNTGCPLCPLPNCATATIRRNGGPRG